MRPGGRPYAGHYRGRLIAVGSRHGKQDQFRPAFDDVLHARLVVPGAIDTDQFGTFTGEAARAGSAVDAARAKARLGAELCGLPLGLASEASYGPLPGSGFVGHEEVLLFRDEELGIEVLEGYRTTSVPGVAHRVADDRDLPAGLVAGLPGQALTARPAAPVPDTAPVIRKGITDTDTLREAIAEAVSRSADGLAIVEPDLRAHHNPSRRRVLAGLALTLARRLAVPCPLCRTPGFGRVETEPGLPCSRCETPTPQPRNEIHACCRCDHTLRRPVSAQVADPADCPECNP